MTRISALLLLSAGVLTAQAAGPEGNPLTPETILLGKALFWDEQLSSTRTVACGTCHLPSAGGSDPRAGAHPGPDERFGTPDDIAGSPGVPANQAGGNYQASASFGVDPQVTARQAPSALNAGFSPALFWDGRAGDELVDPLTGEVVLAAGAALESQALGPLLSAVEMAHEGRDWQDVVRRIEESEALALSPSVPAELERWIGGRRYPALFREAFGDAEVTPVRIAMAIAAYERTLVTDQTPFDLGQLTAQQRRGLGVFRNEGGCARCHSGELFSDNRFHFLGVRPPFEDEGRFNVTGDPADRGAMRTPSLRNVGLRGPYMHNGGLESLEKVIEFYDRGGDFDAPNKRIRPLGLTPAQKADLAAFLRDGLTDPRAAAEQAPFDRPLPYAESDRVPALIGEAPLQMAAIEPPVAGNREWTVALAAAPAGAKARLIVDAVAGGRLPEGAVVVPLAGSLADQTVRVDENGIASIVLALPRSVDPARNVLFGRWLAADPSAIGGVAASAVFRAELFEPGERADGKKDDKTGASGSPPPPPPLPPPPGPGPAL